MSRHLYTGTCRDPPPDEYNIHIPHHPPSESTQVDESGSSPRFDHDGMARHHHDADTDEPVWWTNAEQFGGERRHHLHKHRVADNEAAGSEEPSADARKYLLRRHGDGTWASLTLGDLRDCIAAIEAEARDKAMREVAGHWEREREAREPAWFVHDHGPEEGAGLACREYRVNGRLIGTCLLPAQREPASEEARHATPGPDELAKDEDWLRLVALTLRAPSLDPLDGWKVLQRAIRIKAAAEADREAGE